jgi:hypothetical protein
VPEISFRKIAFIEPSSVEHGLGKIRQVQVTIDESRKRKIGAAEIRPDELAMPELKTQGSPATQVYTSQVQVTHDK